MECKRCKYWAREGADGICRRHSPRPLIAEMPKTYSIIWARTKSDEFCGEWEAIPTLVNDGTQHSHPKS